MVQGFLDLINEYQEMEVYLPKRMFNEVTEQFINASYQQKGIIVETLFCLWLRRVYREGARWVTDIYSPVDFSLTKDMIDVKSTTRSYYRYPDLSVAKMLTRLTTKNFNFVLVSLESWDEENKGITLKVHEVINIDPLGKVHGMKFKNSTKQFL